jgi:hypothetical protein
MNFDMSSVLEGIDLTRSFIRGGLTHTGLFVTGLMAQGLGLSGEDDETKKRRRQARLQGAGFIYDARAEAIQNDFRNADALFLDWLPMGIESYLKDDDVGDTGGMYQMSWMLKQFISPMMGMEKFFETGDWHHVMWGFQDAVGAFPIINTLMWDDAVQTTAELTRMADSEAKGGGPVDIVSGAGLLTTAVGVYERMLFENAFVNALYVGKDRYDRDPYTLPLRDSDGTLQRDIEGNARAQNLSVEQYLVQNRDQLTREITGGKWEGALYIDPENGEIKQGYLARDQRSAALHALTENRATLAIVSSLFDGLGGGGMTNSDFWRYNMPKKEREFDKPEVTQDQAEAYLLAAWRHAGMDGSLPRLSMEEHASLIKADLISQGIFYDEAEVMAEATRRAKADQPAAMSIVIDGREQLTQPGARGVFNGLMHGTVKFGEAALQGLHISYEMREAIQKEWTEEIVQEGLDLGLDHGKAVSRMKRLWGGPFGTGSEVTGLGDLLWSKDISYTDTLKFAQLNTTYVMGPDGRPWATGFKRDGVFNALGLKPVKSPYTSQQEGITGNDARLNTTYLGGGAVKGINTGLRALELVDESINVPTDVEIGKSIEKAIKDAAGQDYAPYTPYAKKGGGYGGYRRRGYSRRGYGGGGGGYSSAGFHSFTRLYALPHGKVPYGDNIPFINTSNPLIRRADVRRERVWSERGRLKQWQ